MHASLLRIACLSGPGAMHRRTPVTADAWEILVAAHALLALLLACAGVWWAFRHRGAGAGASCAVKMGELGHGKDTVQLGLSLQEFREAFPSTQSHTILIAVGYDECALQHTTRCPDRCTRRLLSCRRRTACALVAHC
jgi:hypothetical protein